MDFSHRGYTETRDMTWFINAYSYFPSYNVPYIASISRMSGFSEKVRTCGGEDCESSPFENMTGL